MKNSNDPIGITFADNGGVGQSFGLTKREYFAVMICAGLSPMCIPGSHNTTSRMVGELPEKAVALADALIDELNKRKEDL